MEVVDKDNKVVDNNRGPQTHLDLGAGPPMWPSLRGRTSKLPVREHHQQPHRTNNKPMMLKRDHCNHHKKRHRDIKANSNPRILLRLREVDFPFESLLWIDDLSSITFFSLLTWNLTAGKVEMTF